MCQIDTNRGLLTTDPVTLDHYSEKHFQELVKALGLNYIHVPPDILDKFKQLHRAYPTSFYLPGSQLSMIRGFQHNITTDNDTHICKLPYRKSPSELAAIKEEIHRTLKLKVQANGHLRVSKCANHPPHTLHFVVDYRNLNSVTVGDGYPIPSVDNIFYAICNGKYFGKLDTGKCY